MGCTVCAMPVYTLQSVEVSDNTDANDIRIVIPVQVETNDVGARWTNETRALNIDIFHVNQIHQDGNNEHYPLQAMDN